MNTITDNDYELAIKKLNEQFPTKEPIIISKVVKKIKPKTKGILLLIMLSSPVWVSMILQFFLTEIQYFSGTEYLVFGSDVLGLIVWVCGRIIPEILLITSVVFGFILLVVYAVELLNTKEKKETT